MPDLYVGIYIMCTTSEYVEYTVKNNRLNIFSVKKINDHREGALCWTEL